jgi:hypothetical protein
VLAVAAARGRVSVAQLPAGTLPDPTSLPEVKAVQGNKDPYVPYSKETDYFEVKWKKGD